MIGPAMIRLSASGSLTVNLQAMRAVPMPRAGRFHWQGGQRRLNNPPSTAWICGRSRSARVR